MARGRKRIPTNLHVLHGNPGKRDLDARAAAEPKIDCIYPNCPAWLPPLAKKEYKRLKKVLDGKKIITEADRSALLMHCVSHALFEDGVINYQKMGGAYKWSEKKQGFVRNPYLKDILEACNTMMRIGPELGITPASRGKIKVTADTVEDDPLTAFMKQRKTK